MDDRKSEPLAGPLVDAQARQSPPCSGHVQTCWTVGRLSAFLAARFHGVLSCSSIRRLLHQTGWRWVRPRLAPARTPDPAAETKLTVLETARREVAHGRGHRLYRDESDRPLVPLMRALGMKGPRRRGPTPGITRRRAFCGALDASTGQWWDGEHDRQLAVHLVALLQRLSVAYPPGPLSLALDQAPAQTATVVQAWVKAHPHVTLLWLPK